MPKRWFYRIALLICMTASAGSSAKRASGQSPLHGQNRVTRCDPFQLIASDEFDAIDSSGAVPIELGQNSQSVTALQPATSNARWIQSAGPMQSAGLIQLAAPDQTGMPIQAEPPIRQAALLQQPGFLPAPIAFGPGAANASQFNGSFSGGNRPFGVGVDFYSAPEFEGGLIVHGSNVAMKFGGYTKADFIYDFDPIDSTDLFDTTSIPVGAPPRTNSRAHARQTRLSFDTRWKSNDRVVRFFVEGDFFSADDQFRLRHAYGTVGSFLVGRTWTTFTDVAAAPATLDFEGSVSAVNRRQAQARWTQWIYPDLLRIALSVEDTEFIVIPPPAVDGESRSPSPDFVGQVRLVRDWGQFQFASLIRNGGFQPAGGEVATGTAWGCNFTGVVLLLESTTAYHQILFGEGIGSYRGLPDAAPVTPTSNDVLPLFGWMVGITHQWNESLSSNFTYAANHLENTPLQSPDSIRETTYLAANLIWSPLDRVNIGVEYLFGTRENVDFSRGEANRIQSSVMFLLP